MVDYYRVGMGLRPIPYLWRAERFPARRPRLLRYWHRQHVLALRRYRAYQAALRVSPVGVITLVFGPNAPAAIAVASCESGLDPNAHNPSGASGLFQLMPMWWQGRDPYDPWVNTRIAYGLSSGGTNWSSWVCQP